MRANSNGTSGTGEAAGPAAGAGAADPRARVVPRTSVAAPRDDEIRRDFMSGPRCCRGGWKRALLLLGAARATRITPEGARRPSGRRHERAGASLYHAAPMRQLLRRLGIERADARAWALYDWANSAFYTVIITAVFPIYFQKVAGAGLPEGEALRK